MHSAILTALISLYSNFSGGNELYQVAEYFHGYPCTQDCSGHEAGYEWAQAKGIADPDNCGGNSNSFIEGCRSAAEELQGENEENDQPTEDEEY